MWLFFVVVIGAYWGLDNFENTCYVISIDY